MLLGADAERFWRELAVSLAVFAAREVVGTGDVNRRLKLVHTTKDKTRTLHFSKKYRPRGEVDRTHDQAMLLGEAAVFCRMNIWTSFFLSFGNSLLVIPAASYFNFL